MCSDPVLLVRHHGPRLVASGPLPLNPLLPIYPRPLLKIFPTSEQVIELTPLPKCPYMYTVLNGSTREISTHQLPYS